MTRPKPKYQPQPALLNTAATAFKLNLSPGKFKDVLPRLYEAGFPRPDDILDDWYEAAIDEWLRRRNGLKEPETGGGAE